MKTDVEIIVTTIRMQAPLNTAENNTKRKSFVPDAITEKLIADEEFLRRNAYKNTAITVDESFFDDSDMKSEYFLVVIYDKISGTPLLSSRYYFDRPIINQVLKGDHNTNPELRMDEKKFSIENFGPGRLFLADRLSGNTKNEIYRNFHERIFFTFYIEIVNTNPGCHLLLMVRKERDDKQLLKYLQLGFVLLGSTIHKGKEHCIILGELNNFKS